VGEKENQFADEEMSITRRALEGLFSKKHRITRNVISIGTGLVAVVTRSKVIAALFIILLLFLVAARLYLSIVNSRLFRKFFRPRRVRLTSECWWFILLTLAIGTAAVNTGSNLLYLVLSMMLSFIVVSGILSEIGFRRIDVVRSLPYSVFAGDWFEVGVSVSNRKRVFSSFSLFVEDSPESAKVLQKQGRRCFVARIAPGGRALLLYTARVLRRGVFTFKNLRISSRFPFHFFENIVSLRKVQSILVYPRIYALQEDMLVSRHERSDALRKLSLHAAGDEDFRGLKEFRDGDNPRRIHWVSSARHRKLMVKEFEKQRANRVCVILDTYWVAPGEKREENFETAVSLTASIISFFNDRNYATAFAAYTPTLVRKRSGTGKRHFYGILEALAYLENSDKPISELVEHLDSRELRDSLIYVVAAKLSPRCQEAVRRLRRFSSSVRIIQTGTEGFADRFRAQVE
jgi:uncharacterized protein (DUF58 family)